MGLKTLWAHYHLARLKRKVKSREFTIPGDLVKARHILICLPDGLRELTSVKQYLPVINYLFTKADVTLLTMPGLQVTDIYPRKGFQIMTPSVDQMHWAGMPKKGFISMLQGYKFDLILDMTLDPSVFTSAILLSFPDAIRVGRSNHLGEPYYNLEIRTRYLRDERNIYRSLLETLGDIMARKVQEMPSQGR